MIYSMTAYAGLDIESPFGLLRWEIRSVNHRYLEIGLKIPEEIREMEWELREVIRKRLNRGKIDCILKIDKSTESKENALIMDLSLVDRLIAANLQIIERLPQGSSYHFPLLKSYVGRMW